MFMGANYSTGAVFHATPEEPINQPEEPRNQQEESVNKPEEPRNKQEEPINQHEELNKTKLLSYKKTICLLQSVSEHSTHRKYHKITVDKSGRPLLTKVVTSSLAT